PCARPRLPVHTRVLAAIVIAFIYSLSTRPPFRVDIVRDRGALARIVDDGYVENVYRIQLMNASEQVQRYRIGVERLNQPTITGGEEVVLGPADSRWVPVAVRVPPEVAARMGSGAFGMTVVVEQLRQGNQPQVDIREKTTFMVPR